MSTGFSERRGRWLWFEDGLFLVLHTSRSFWPGLRCAKGLQVCAGPALPGGYQDLFGLQAGGPGEVPTETGGGHLGHAAGAPG